MIASFKTINGENGIGYDEFELLFNKINLQMINNDENNIILLDDYKKKIFAKSLIIGAVIDENFIGFASVYVNDYRNKEAYITYIGLLEEYCNKGIGTELLKIVENESKQRGMKIIKLEVLNTNNRAISFYNKHNFSFSEYTNRNSMYMVKQL